jgi:hypothetical protein
MQGIAVLFVHIKMQAFVRSTFPRKVVIVNIEISTGLCVQTISEVLETNPEPPNKLLIDPQCYMKS